MHSPETFLDARSKERVPLSRFRGKDVVTLAGIGDPKSFEDTLANLKAVPVQIWRYPDHHQFTRGELAAIEATRAGLPLITTFKDFARFPQDWPRILEGGVFILSVKVVFLCDGYKRLMQTITSAKAAEHP